MTFEHRNAQTIEVTMDAAQLDFDPGLLVGGVTKFTPAGATNPAWFVYREYIGTEGGAARFRVAVIEWGGLALLWQPGTSVTIDAHSITAPDWAIDMAHAELASRGQS